MAQISGTVTTLNEERNIADCLRSMQQVCDEIYVVDSLSSDKTVEIARSMGAKIILQAYLGDGPQKNVSLPHLAHDWVLSLDADERLDDEAIASLKALDLDNPKHVTYGFRKKNYIGDRWVRGTGMYPDIRGRLYDRRQTRWNDEVGHTRLLSRDIGLLDGHMIHFAYTDYEQLLAKHLKYAKRGSRMLYDKGKRANALTPYGHALGDFLKHYVLEAGFRAGVDGLTVSMVKSFAGYMKYAYLLEIQRGWLENDQPD